MFDALAYSPPLVVLAGYLVTRRSLPRSASLLLFDCVAVAVAVLVGACLFWREITRRAPNAALAEEQLWVHLIAPTGIAIISVLFFLSAATIRYLIFSRD